MSELLLEFVICAMAAAFLMIVHELSKSVVFMIMQGREGRKKYSHSIWLLYRYIDPIGILLAITSSVTFSKPFMFRIRDKRTNRVLGITGFLVLLLCFAASITAIRLHAFGVSGMTTLKGRGIVPMVVTLWIQYSAILSGGMFVANLFPVSIFDMGLLIAGISSEKYLNIIKMDAVIKLIFIITIILGLIHYGCYRLIVWLV